MTFILIVLLTALLMEGVGSYISVVGWSALFAGDAVILAMAVILDIAKITTVSFLYQYWNEMKKTMRAYLTTAALVLMIITSAGAFGYLFGAIQKATQPNLEVQLRVDALVREQNELTAEKKELTAEKLKLNDQIAKLPDDQVNGRQRLIASFKPEQTRITNRLATVNKRVDELQSEVLKVKGENIEKDVHVGPISFVAKAFGVSMEEASKWVVLMIIAVFDPLAVMLVLAANFLILRRKQTPPPPPEVQEEMNVEALDKLRDVLNHDFKIAPVQPTIVPPTIEELIAVEPPPRPVVAEPAHVVMTTPPIEVEPSVATLSPAAELIDPPLPASELAALKVNLPGSLIRPGVVTPSKVRDQYSD